MKNTILTLVIIIVSFLSCKAQSIIPVENAVEYWGEGIPEHITEIKDVNGLLNKFVGKWIGNHKDTRLELIVIKQTSQSITGRNLLIDELLIKHKITDSIGDIIEDTTNEPDDSYSVMFGKYLSKQGQYVLYYQGSKAECGQNGDVFISINPNDPNEMSFSYYRYGEIWRPDCTTGPAEQVLPKEEIILTKLE